MSDRNLLLDGDDEEIADVMEEAIGDALREHRREGVSIAVWDWDHDRVEIVQPEEIILPADSADVQPTSIR